MSCYSAVGTKYGKKTFDFVFDSSPTGRDILPFWFFTRIISLTRLISIGYTNFAASSYSAVGTKYGKKTFDFVFYSSPTGRDILPFWFFTRIISLTGLISIGYTNFAASSYSAVCTKYGKKTFDFIFDSSPTGREIPPFWFFTRIISLTGLMIFS
ncbi:MAG: hypothetical protein IPK35_03650 [Saprospiraceae bacterium]|nr:hypothetical protein [Saprospiraceae bacterium]